MANVETMGLGPQKSMFVLVIIIGCFAVLWPRILSPMFVGPVKDSMSPNSFDREAGCCDVISDTDVNAIKIMAEVCNNILRSQGGKVDSKMEQALASGKLTAEIISTCRQEVNRTCGVDIALFLDHNIRLGKTYRQILDDVRSYNSSNCLKMNYGVAPWSLGVPHLVGKYSFKTMSVRQERPPHLQHPPLHPALRERGRAIVNPVNVPRAPRAPSQGPPLPGRVWPSQLHPYLSNYSAQPMHVRPPMGGAGGVVPPPKSSVGFLMPLYTLCIVVFFFYTVFKMVFTKGSGDVSPVHQPRYIERPESKFTQSVFKNTSRRDRNSPETKLVVNAISGLVAEVRQQMEDIPQYRSDALHNQEVPPPYTNGSVHRNQKEETPLLSKGQERPLREPTPPSWEDSTPVDREESLLAKEFTILKEEPIPTKESDKENVPPQEESKQEEYEKDVAVKEAGLLKEVPSKETSLERDLLAAAADLQYEPEYPEKIGEVVEEKLIEEAAIRQLRSSVEKENASFKVLGMEMRAHCEGGAPWSKRSTTPPAGRVTPPPSMHSRQPTPPVEVSSIYLEGALPHQSRLLVADSETHTEKLTNGDDKDPPIVLSGKMTLSLINDESAKTTPERDNAVKDDLPSVKDDLPYDDDEEFLTASAATSPKQDEAEYEDGSEEEIDEDQIDEDMEVRNMLEDQPAQKNFLQGERVQRSTGLQGEETFQDVVAPVDENHEATKIEEVLATNADDFEAAFDKLVAAMEEDIVTDVDEYQNLIVEEDKPTFLQGERVSSTSPQGEETIQDVVAPVDELHEATKIEEVLATDVDDFVAAVDKLAAAMKEEELVVTNVEEDVVADVDEYQTSAVEEAQNDFLQGESLQGEDTIQDIMALDDDQLEATKIEEVLTTNVDYLVTAVEEEKHIATNIEEDFVAEVDKYETTTVEEDQPAQNDFLQGERISSISLQGEETIQDVVAPVDEDYEATKIDEFVAADIDDFLATDGELAASIKEGKHLVKNFEEDVVAEVDKYETTTVEEDQPAQNDFLQGERISSISLQGEETIQDVVAPVDEHHEATKIQEVLAINVEKLVAAVEEVKHVATNIEEDVVADIDDYQTTTVEEDQPTQNEFLQGERVSSTGLQGEETIQDAVAPVDEDYESTEIDQFVAADIDDFLAAVGELTAAVKEKKHVVTNVEEDVVTDVDEYQTATVEEDIPQYIEYIVATSVSQDLTGNAIDATDRFSANVAAIASEKIEDEDDIITKVTEAPYVEVLESTNLEDLVSAIINGEFALDEVLTNISNDEVAKIEYDDELEPAFVEDLEDADVEYEVVVSAADDVTSNAEICETSSVYDAITSLEDTSTADGATDNVTSNIDDYKSTILEDEVAPNVVDDETTNVEGKKLKNIDIQDISDLEVDLLKNLEVDVPSNVVEERKSAKVETVNIVEDNASDEEEEYEEEIIEEEVEEEEEIEEVEEEEEIEEVEEEEEEIEEKPAVNKGATVKKA